MTIISGTHASAAPTISNERKVLRRIVLDLIIFIALLIPIIVCEFIIEPYERGFFCDDESIRYPFHGNTVTPVMLGLICGLPALFGFISTEFNRFYRHGHMGESVKLFCWQVPTWLAECHKQISFFVFGLLLTLNATEIGKFTIGRLRPHFIAVCQPQFRDGSSCRDAVNQYRYIESYSCTAHGYGIDDVRQARLSFPSGHASCVFFAMVYLAIYINYRISWRGSRLSRHFLQFLLVSMAWFTALSRVMDNWHHWSDVAVGILIGVVCAVITARYIAKMQSMPLLGSLKISIPRQDTSTTLQEHCSSTPPPYTINTSSNSLSDEQYCTKV